MAKKSTNTSKSTENTTTQVAKKAGLLSKVTSGTFGLVKKGAKCIWPVAKTALVVMGVENIAEMTYEKVTGNEITWDFQKDSDSFGVTIKKNTVYVGESSRGSEFDDTFSTENSSADDLSVGMS